MTKKIIVKVLVTSSLEKVWDAWTKPEHIVKWNFATDDWQCPKASNDLSVGGKYFARMEAKDGSFGFDFVAIYNVVELKKRLVYTMEDGRLSATDFKNIDENIDENIEVITSFDSEGENSDELQREGWQSILNNFKKYVEKLILK